MGRKCVLTQLGIQTGRHQQNRKGTKAKDARVKTQSSRNSEGSGVRIGMQNQ